MGQMKERQITLRDVGGAYRKSPTEVLAETFDVDAYIDEFTPQHMKMFLDAHVIGNEEAKRVMAMQIYMGCEYNLSSNCLYIGGSGSGKTYLAQCVAEEFGGYTKPNRTCYWLDCSLITPQGYKDDCKFQSFIDSIPQNGRPKMAILDEFDKIVDSNSYGSTLGMKLQDEMLTAFDRTNGRNDISFVCLGAFTDLFEKKAKSHSIGFGTITEEPDMSIQPIDLIEYGFRAELIGRIDHIVCMDSVSQDAYRRMVRFEASKLAQRINIGIDLDDDIINSIASDALDSPFGARAIRSAIRDLVERQLYLNPYADVINLRKEIEADM